MEINRTWPPRHQPAAAAPTAATRTPGTTSFSRASTSSTWRWSVARVNPAVEGRRRRISDCWKYALILFLRLYDRFYILQAAIAPTSQPRPLVLVSSKTLLPNLAPGDISFPSYVFKVCIFSRTLLFFGPFISDSPFHNRFRTSVFLEFSLMLLPSATHSSSRNAPAVALSAPRTRPSSTQIQEACPAPWTSRLSSGGERRHGDDGDDAARGPRRSRTSRHYWKGEDDFASFALYCQTLSEVVRGRRMATGEVAVCDIMYDCGVPWECSGTGGGKSPTLGLETEFGRAGGYVRQVGTTM